MGEALIQVRDHGMVLPDIGSFPDCQKFLSEDLYFDGIGEALRKLDMNAFSESIIELSSMIPVFSAEEAVIKSEHLKRIKEMGRQHILDANRKAKVSREDIAPSEAYNQLLEHGVFSDRLEISKLNKILSRDITNLLSAEQKNLNRGYDRSIALDRAKHSKAFSFLNKTYEKFGFLADVSKYHSSKDLRIKSVCLHVASPGDTHYNQTLKDCETTSKLVGMHFDPKYVMKSLLYLNDVDIDSGPFTYVPQSHRWYFEEGQRIAAKGTSVGNYLNSEKHRAVAMRFPINLRVNSIFGRLVPDESELSNMLLSREKAFLGEAGTCILFDPSTGFHRGGICNSKQRINLQIIFG